MSNCKYESKIKTSTCTPETIFNKLSDLRNFEKFKTMFDDPNALDNIKNMAPGNVSPKQLEQFAEYIKKMEFEQESVSVNSPMGNITMTLIEKEEPKLLKFEGAGAPIPLAMWIQLLPHESGSKLKITVGAEVSFFMKAMVNKPLQQAADGIAEMLAKIPYNNI